MLDAHLIQGGLLKKVFDAIKDMVPEVNLDCSSEGIQLQAMDNSHVALVSLNLKTEAFDTYKCDRPRTIGLNMTAVAKVFKLCGNDDAVMIRHDDDAETISFVFESGDERVSNFDLKLLEIDQEHLGVPDATFTSSINMPSRTYQKICLDLAQFSDSIAIEASSKQVKFSSKGDIGSGNIILKPKASEEDPVGIESDGDVSSLFAVRYLNYFAKASPLSSQVELKLSPGHPLEVTFNINNDPSIGYLRFHLAPKLDDAEETQD